MKWMRPREGQLEELKRSRASKVMGSERMEAQCFRIVDGRLSGPVVVLLSRLRSSLRVHRCRMRVNDDCKWWGLEVKCVGELRVVEV